MECSLAELDIIFLIPVGQLVEETQVLQNGVF